MEVSVFVMSSDAKSILGTTMEMGEREIIYIYTYRYFCVYHQNDFCIKAGNDESHFNVS